MISVKLEGFDEAMASLNPKHVKSAARMAINDGARAGRTEAARRIRERWNVKAAKVNTELRNTVMASSSKLEAVISAKGRPVSLSYYGFKQIQRVTKGKGGKYRQTRGVTGSILKGVKVSYRRAFKATMQSGFTGVFVNEADYINQDYLYRTPRRGNYAGQRGRNSIINLATITLPSMLEQPRVMEPTLRTIRERMADRFAYHLERLSAGGK
jgi:hypothetical protein